MIQNLRDRIYELFDGPTLTQLATINRFGRPWVRYVMSTIDREMVLRIPTRSDTRKVREIGARPDVHLLVGKELFSSRGAYAQIEGCAIITTDPRCKKKEWNRSMERYFSGSNDPGYVIIEIRPYRIEYWSVLEEENPAILDTDDLLRGEEDSDEYWVAEGESVPVFV